MDSCKINTQKFPVTQSLEQQKFNKSDYFKELDRWIWRAPFDEIFARELCAKQIANAYENSKTHLRFSALCRVTERPPLFPGLSLELDSPDHAMLAQHPVVAPDGSFFWRTAHNNNL